MFDRIVVAVDGSPSADRALDYAARLAGESRGSIIAVHVIELIAGRGAGPVHANEDELKEQVTSQVARLKQDGLHADLQLVSSMTGGPAHAIAQVAQREGADVIITGTRGHTPLAGVFLGSVAQRLMHIAPCPVLVVPAEVREDAGDLEGRQAGVA